MPWLHRCARGAGTEELLITTRESKRMPRVPSCRSVFQDTMSRRGHRWNVKNTMHVIEIAMLRRARAEAGELMSQTQLKGARSNKGTR